MSSLTWMPRKGEDHVKSWELPWSLISSYLPSPVTNESRGVGNKPSSWEDSCSLSPLLLPSVDNYCPVSAENVWYLIFPHHLNKHVAITERYLATGVERCICMKESVYTLARQTTAFSFAKLREVPMSQNRQNRYIDFGCIFGRKLLKIQNIKKIGKQNITTSVYNWCDFSLNEPSCRSPR